MKKAGQGFTLIEVVLAIAVGLIIIAGVSVGYTYAKRAAILDNERKNVAAIKTFVEQAIAATQAAAADGSASLKPPAITVSQLTALADRLPSLKFDPYNGKTRVEVCGTTPNSCYQSIVGTAGPGPGSWGPTQDTLTGVYWPPGSGSAVYYISGDTFKRSFSIILADGSVRTFFSYVILESDADGNFVAADGGDITTTQIGP